MVRRRFYPPEHIRKLYSEDLKEYPPESSMLIGTEGSLLIPHGASAPVAAGRKIQGVKRPKLPPRNHYHHFVDACLGGEKTESHFAQTGPMTEAILLGTVAIRVPGQRLEWDRPPQVHQPRRSQPPAATRLPRRLAPGRFLTGNTRMAATAGQIRLWLPRDTTLCDSPGGVLTELGRVLRSLRAGVTWGAGAAPWPPPSYGANCNRKKASQLSTSQYCG